MDESTWIPGDTRERGPVVERKLLAFEPLELDAAEVRASRDFHIAHWLQVAEAAIRSDHREICYGSLSPSIEATLAEAQEPVEPELQRAILKDLAFLEGHVQAFRLVLTALQRLRTENR